MKHKKEKENEFAFSSVLMHSSLSSSFCSCRELRVRHVFSNDLTCPVPSPPSILSVFPSLFSLFIHLHLSLPFFKNNSERYHQ
jgi:hypothetical protein